MVWVRLDDHFDENPKIAAVGPLGIALWVTSLAYCNRNLTDGFIPTSIAIRMLSLEFEHPGDGGTCTVLVGGEPSDDDPQTGSIPDRYYIPNILVYAGLWERVENGYQIHDYAQFQPSKADVEADRASARARMADVRAKRGGSSADVQANTEGSAEVQANFEGSSPYPVPVPVPSLSKDKLSRPASRSIAPEGETPLPPPKKTVETVEWKAEMKRVHGPNLEDFEGTWNFILGSAYLKRRDDRRGYIEGQLLNACKRWVGRNGHVSQTFKSEGIFE